MELAFSPSTPVTPSLLWWPRGPSAASYGCPSTSWAPLDDQAVAHPLHVPKQPPAPARGTWNQAGAAHSKSHGQTVPGRKEWEKKKLLFYCPIPARFSLNNKASALSTIFSWHCFILLYLYWDSCPAAAPTQSTSDMRIKVCQQQALLWQSTAWSAAGMRGCCEFASDCHCLVCNPGSLQVVSKLICPCTSIMARFRKTPFSSVPLLQVQLSTTRKSNCVIFVKPLFPLGYTVWDLFWEV